MQLNSLFKSQKPNFFLPVPEIRLPKPLKEQKPKATSFSQLFKPGLLRKLFPRLMQNKLINTGEFAIHSPSSIQNLIQEKIAKREKPDLRYIVDADGAIWFARETHSNIRAPAHYQMLEPNVGIVQCLAAGNLFFSDDYKQLVKINHKSGDFRPDFESLKFALVILVKCIPQWFGDNILVERMDGSGKVMEVLLLETSDLVNQVNALLQQEDCQFLLNQNHKEKSLVYKPTRSDDFNSQSPLKRVRKNLFPEDSDLDLPVPIPNNSFTL